jgi:hypothetical protein
VDWFVRHRATSNVDDASHRFGRDESRRHVFVRGRLILLLFVVGLIDMEVAELDGAASGSYSEFKE